MLRSLFSFTRFIFFWLVFSVITRATFELYFTDKLQKASFGEIFQTFFYGVRIDASAAGYIAVLPLLVFIIGWFIPGLNIKGLWLRVYVYFCIFIISLVSILNLNIFREWGSKISYRVFDTLYHSPSEAMASTGSSPIGLSLFIGALLLAAGIIISNYIVDYNFKKPELKWYIKPFVIALLAGLNLLLIRGGVQLSPMNQSMAYFSDKQILNQSALNTEWNLLHNTVENFKTPYNPYLYMSAHEAESVVDSMYSVKKDTTVKILTTTKPNIVVIQIESFTADLIESLGGEKGDAPNFEDFIKHGLLFDSVYATSDRTDKGIVGILSAFPSQAIRTVIVDNVKQERLPSLTKVFYKQHYATSYMYGGESEFMNFKAYMLSHKTNEVIDKKNFDAADMNSKWGAHDDVVMKKHIKFLNEEEQPFFSYLQTLSNHEPFDLPVPSHFPGEDLINKFRSTAYYTDASLKEYLDLAKKEDWYKNTLFILVADHGHRLPLNNADPFEPQKYHIPLLFFGDVVKPEYRGKRIHKLGSQTDIAATLLAQLNIPNEQFKWSKNLLNPHSKEFAFFDWDNGFGFMVPGQVVSYDNAGKRIIYNAPPSQSKNQTEELLQYGKAFMQQVFAEYMKL
ncbi:sulfatase-like hydrolase/transferase [Mucilaginibacter sp. JRF]|uniref:LTA synthase family protein n=1 Tax=Mucilaginibacter sp. JRF TaxID=2780088 RepID=UPI0018816ECF|nr:alkaline phosphatase family protein [Mucilaginibacter sp. JRF]MBE9586151.1 sulfatase-like hydrolase/transferase [Mucilaginibacter sp. JRF]